MPGKKVGKLLSSITCESDQEIREFFVIQDIGVTPKYWRSKIRMLDIFTAEARSTQRQRREKIRETTLFLFCVASVCSAPPR